MFQVFNIHWLLFSQSCSTLCSPMDCSMPSFPVPHQLPELAQTHVRQVGDAINHLILCQPLLPSVFPSIGVFSNESVLCVRSDTEFCSSKCSFHSFSKCLKTEMFCATSLLHLFLYFFNDLITVTLKSLFFLAFIDYFISWLLFILPSFAHLVIFIVC